MDYPFISIEGNIGAGKTTLAKMLAKDYNAELILEEFEDNPFLPEFYKDPTRVAFPVELFFMAERYQQLQETIQKDLFASRLISDYIFSKSKLFSENNLNEKEFELYLRIFKIIYAQLPQPDIILYLHNSIPVLQKHIEKRGREYEKDIKPEYLKSIEEAYFKHFKEIQSTTKVLILKADTVDFVGREIDYLRIKRILEKDYPVGIHII